MKNLRIPLRVVFYLDGADWVAHCLEFDLMGDGPTKEVALDYLAKAISLQLAASLEGNNVENLFTPADGKYFAMFAAGKDVVVGELHLQASSFEFEPVETREFFIWPPSFRKSP